MKKLILLFAVGILTNASFCFATETFTNSSAPSGVNGVLAQYRTSASVRLHVTASAASYNAVAAHDQGNQMYGSSSGDAVIYRAAKAAGTPVATTDVPSLPATATDTTGFPSAGWTAL